MCISQKYCNISIQKRYGVIDGNISFSEKHVQSDSAIEF